MPIITTPNDVVFVGHGSYLGGANNFALPAGVQLNLLQPVGTSLTEGPVLSLVGRTPIDRLVLSVPGNQIQDLQPLGLPTVYNGGQMVPNLVLHDLGNLRALVQGAIPAGPNHVIMVNQDTNLQTLLAQPQVVALIAAHVAMGTSLRVFWAACMFQPGNPTEGQGVFCNGVAVALAASAYARRAVAAPGGGGGGSPASIAAATAALAYATAHPLDTAGTIAAAAAHDHATANAAQPI